LLIVSLATGADAQQICVGDCDGNGAVGINELVIGVNIALDLEPLATCMDFDSDHDDTLRIAELLGGVRSSIDGCRAPDPTPTPTPEAPAQFVAEPAHFECLTKWTRIRHFRITNHLGHLDEALAVARGEMPPPYPIGTIIQLFPGEAMAKRGGGYFPEGNDWEFFVLSASPTGTEITKRGRAEVVNVGPSCFSCHGAAASNDFICESGHGCIELGLSEGLINVLQNNDPRCTAGPAAGP
jgi:hypothetical protein